MRTARSADPLHVVNAAFRDPWHRAVLVLWSLLEPLGGLVPSAMVGPTSRAWFDELRLAPVVATALRGAGIDEGAAWSAAERVRLLLALARPSNVGGRAAAGTRRRLVDAWFGQSEVRAFLRVNLWDGVEWFGRDEWRELLDWALLLDALDADDQPDGLKREVELIVGLADAGERAGYRVDALRDAVAPRPRAARS